MKKLLLPLVGLGLALPLAAGANDAAMSRVYEYMPAPGQFVNTLPAYAEGDDAASMALKAEQSLKEGGMISLGAWGGYVVLGWERPVVNVPGEYDFKVLGNSFGNSAEPGVIMVSRDDNANGLPDDPWYQIAGSEYNNPATVRPCTVTYMRPADPLTDPVEWTSDNSAKPSGQVPRNNFHTQSYWPEWVGGDAISFTGEMLPDNYTVDNGVYNLHPYAYGYADNQPNTTDPGVKIDWAVDADGQPANLPYIDFVKVYTGVQQVCGPMVGEASTEVAGATDLHPDAPAPLIAATFEGLPFAQGSDWWDGSAEADPDEDLTENVFQSGSFLFNNYYYTPYASWEGWGYSRTTSSAFPGYQEGQFNSACGGAYDGSEVFGIVYAGNFYGHTTATFNNDENRVIPGAMFTNDAWVYDEIVNGDGYITPFAEGDWMKMTLKGYDSEGAEQGVMDIYLADYRSTNHAEWTLVKDWTWFDLSPLGAVNEVRFSFSSSRTNAYGNLMPAYACVDNFGCERPSSSAIGQIASDGDACGAYSVSGLTVSVAPGTAASLYNLAGQQVASGLGTVAAPAPGLYLLRLADGSCAKLRLR